MDVCHRHTASRADGTLDHGVVATGLRGRLDECDRLTRDRVDEGVSCTNHWCNLLDVRWAARALVFEWQLIQRPPIVFFPRRGPRRGHPKDRPQCWGWTYPWPVAEIGLFPLGVVLLPTERVPLHIFEPRYRELIEECLETDGEFGLLYADEDGVRDVGTLARITEVLERFDDGRLNVLVEGGRRFRVERLTRGRSFMTAAVEQVEDGSGPVDAETSSRAAGAFRALAVLAGVEAEDPDESSPQLSFELAAQVELLPDAKQ